MDIAERLRNFGPDWTLKQTGMIVPYEVCVDAADEIDRLRAGLYAIIVANQIAGAAPPHVTLRRLPEFNVETWDGPHAALARRVLEQ